MHCPGGGSVAAVVLVVVIVGMAAGGDGLRTGRAHLPGAAVDAAARLAGRDRDGGPVHLFGSFQLLLVRIDSKRQIETAAGRLRRCCPVGRIVFGVGSVGDFFTAALRRDLLAHDGNDLPGIPGRRVIDIGVIPIFARIGSRSVLRSLFSQCLGRSPVGLRSKAVRVVLHDPQLGVIVIAVGSFCGIFFRQPKGRGRCIAVLFFQ